MSGKSKGGWMSPEKRGKSLTEAEFEKKNGGRPIDYGKPSVGGDKAFEKAEDYEAYMELGMGFKRDRDHFGFYLPHRGRTIDDDDLDIYQYLM